jgi:hypothetical protein
MIHDYHFKLNEKSKLELLKISKDMKLSMSSTIVLLFEKFLPFVEKNHLKSKEKNSKYKVIADLKEKRYRIHCYMQDHLYRKKKHLHHDLNVFSMAQILRSMIDIFIFGCNKYGINEFINKLDKIIKLWKNKKEIYRKEKIIFIRQLYMKIINFPKILVYYDQNSHPLNMMYI